MLTANPVQERQSRGQSLEDGKVYTFKIRPNAKWSDGRPLTASDFVESWKRTLSPETAASYNYQLFYVKNAQPFAEGKITDFSQVGVKALDDHTLEVTLENPTPFFLDLCATPPLQPVPVDRIKQFGDDWVKPGKNRWKWRLCARRLADQRPDPPSQEHQLLERQKCRAGKRRSPADQRGYGRVQFLCGRACRPDRGQESHSQRAARRAKKDARLPFRSLPWHLFSALQLLETTIQRPARATRLCDGRGQAPHRRKNHSRGRIARHQLRATRHCRL